MSNTSYINRILTSVGDREPKYKLGREVATVRHGVGVVDAIYTNFESRLDKFVVPDDWYEIQAVPPRTPKTGFFYSITTDEGGILAGEDDIEGGVA